MAVTRFVAALSRREGIRRFGDGQSTWRDYLHVDDVVSGLLAAARRGEGAEGGAEGGAEDDAEGGAEGGAEGVAFIAERVRDETSRLLDLVAERSLGRWEGGESSGGVRGRVSVRPTRRRVRHRRGIIAPRAPTSRRAINRGWPRRRGASAPRD